MKRYLLFPPGYDPMVAAAPNPDLGWSMEDTQRHRELEKQAVIITCLDDEKLPKGRWTMEITEGQP